MDAIKPGFWSDSEPINLIRDALNHAEIAHTDGLQVKYLPLGVGARYVTVCQSLPPHHHRHHPRRPLVTAVCRQTGVRTRTQSVGKRLARVKILRPSNLFKKKKKKKVTTSPHLVVVKGMDYKSRKIDKWIYKRINQCIQQLLWRWNSRT